MNIITFEHHAFNIICETADADEPPVKLDDAFQFSMGGQILYWTCYEYGDFVNVLIAFRDCADNEKFDDRLDLLEHLNKKNTLNKLVNFSIDDGVLTASASSMVTENGYTQEFHLALVEYLVSEARTLKLELKLNRPSSRASP